MLIKKIEIIYIKLPMKIVFQTSFGKIKYRPALIIKMIDSNGNIGYGEASLLDVPISENETSEVGLKILEEKVIPIIIGMNIKSVFQLHFLLKKYFKNFPVTLTGIESAYLNLFSINKGRSLVDLFHGEKDKIQIGKSIGIQKNKNKLFDSIEEGIRSGYKKIKIKIKPGYDIDIIKGVRKRFPSLSFAVDANEAYSKKDLLLFKKMDQLNLFMIEQPFKDNEFKLHAELQKMIKTPLCLDESVININTAQKAIKMKSCKIINIKPARVGGYVNAIKIHNLCQKHRMPCWVGGRLETGLAKIFNLSLASLSNFSFPSEITPAECFLVEDIISTKINFKNGVVKIPKLKNNQISLNDKKLNKYTISRKIFFA